MQQHHKRMTEIEDALKCLQSTVNGNQKHEKINNSFCFGAKQPILLLDESTKKEEEGTTNSSQSKQLKTKANKNKKPADVQLQLKKLRAMIKNYNDKANNLEEEAGSYNMFLQ